MPNGVEGRWLSYAELGELLGCTPNAARMHAVRRKWPRRASNKIGEPAHVLVPPGAVVRTSAMHTGEQFVAPVRRTASDEHSSAIRALEGAIDGLRDQLVDMRQRLDRAEAERREAVAKLTAVITAQAPPAAVLEAPRRRWWFRRPK